MPKPNPGESQKDFVSRCIPLLVNEGEPIDQAVAICYSVFEEDSEKKIANLEIDTPESKSKESELGFSVVTDKEGKSRWIAISSTAYEDRSGQIVSQKALEQAVAINDYRDYHGPLRWWHLGGYDENTLKAVPGFDIGDCDFSMPYGKFLVESGTFRDERFADVAKNGDYELSIRFLHPRNEPDENGIFENVVIFERSLLPRGKADNRFTSFLVSQKENIKMDYQAKVKEFTEKLDDPDFVTALTAQLDERQNALDKRGVRSKEKDEAAGVLAKIKALINPEGSTAKKEPEEPVAPVAWVPTEDTMKSLISGAVEAGVSAALKVVEKSAVEQDTEKAIREAQENALSRIRKLETDLADAKKEMVEIVGLPGYRPTQDNGNVTEKAHAGPDNSGVSDFVSRSTAGQAQGAKVS